MLRIYRVSKWVSLLVLLVAVIGIAYAVLFASPRFQVQVRENLFSGFTSDALAFDQLEPNGYMMDSQELISERTEQLISENTYLQELRDADVSALSDSEKAVTLALAHPNETDGGVSCGGYATLAGLIRGIGPSTNQACCSDKSERFLALSLMFGLTAREIRSQAPHRAGERTRHRPRSLRSGESLSRTTGAAGDAGPISIGAPSRGATSVRALPTHDG